MNAFNNRQWLFLITIFYFLGQNIYSQPITLSSSDFSAQQTSFNLTPFIAIFKDTSTRLSLQQVVGQPFQKHQKDHFIFPYSNDVFWVRFILKNKDIQNKDWWIEWGNPLAEQLDFYVLDSSQKQVFLHKQQKIITSERIKPLIAEDPKFALQLASQQTKVVYIKLASKRGHYGSIRLYTKESYYKSQINGFAGQGFFNGLVIFRLFLVLILGFFVIKDLAFRLYSLHTVIKTFAYWGFLNIAGPLFTDNPDLAKKIDFLFYNSITLGSGLFILLTLAIDKLPKWHSFLIGGILIFTVLDGIIVFFDYQWYWLKAGLYGIVFSSMYFMLLYIYCLVKQIPIGKYYAIPFILGLLSYFLLYVRLLGWVEYSPIYGIAYLFFLGEIFVFVLFLGRIFKNVEENKLVAEQKLHFNLEQNTRLKELDNLKTTFFTNISHELRTPLSLLVGPLAELKRAFPNEWNISVMQRNVARLQKLINQLLDLSKLEAGKLEIIIQKADIVLFTQQLMASFESLAQSRQIIFNYSQNIKEKEAYFDADKIETILINLLSNAFKFTPPNGRVIVDTNYSDTQVQFTIKDFGIGIDPEKLPFIYDRFYQVQAKNQRNDEGTGIGLAIVKELVGVLKGKISVKSEPNRGTTFTIELPIDKATWKDKKITITPIPFQLSFPLDDEQIPVPHQIEEGKELPLLLIVEDNSDLRKLIKNIFIDTYQVVEAINGQDGLEKALSFVPNMIIADLMMPIMDGIDLCKGLKTDIRTSHIPIIMLTAKATLKDRLIGLELGADDYLTKPFEPDELLIRVKNLIKQRENLRIRYSQHTTEEHSEAVVIAPTTDEQFLQKAEKIIENYLSESSFDIETFATEMTLSPVQLRRKLKALTGQTLTEYIRNYRLRRAAELLQNKAGTVSEIAYQVGFESLSYFSKAFLEKFKKNASEWP